ncbi:MAG TPA: hypothetical protein VEJ16_16235 [Alphaproteobacteria bacterium]|nr:hypothetical protein [Alphaproteobacteria bacterium]
MNSRSRDAAYWRRRIERDYPEVAERLRKGEIVSVRAAAIEAGLIHQPSPLLELRRAWRKASAADRAAFMADVAVRELAQQQFAVHRQRRERVVHGDTAANGGAMPLPLNLPKQPHRATPNVTQIAPRVVSEGEIRRLDSSQSLGTLPGAGSLKPDEKVLRIPQEHVRGEPISAPPTPPTPLDPRQGKHRSGVRRLWGLVSLPSTPGDLDTSESARSSGPGIKVGDRFYKVDAGPVPWEVLSVSPGPHGVQHARIACVEEPDTVRTVSFAALTDPGRYQRIR